MQRITFDALRKDPALQKQARELLTNGGIVAFPTETVYGVGTLADHVQGAQRLRQLKGLPDDAPLALHIATPEEALDLLREHHPAISRFARKVLPGPVTLSIAGALPGGPRVIRVPDAPAATWLIQNVGPLLAVSSGAIDPDDAARAWEGKADLLIDAGRTRYGKPSTHVAVEPGPSGRPMFKVTREGVFNARYIHKLLRFTLLLVCSGNTCRSPMAAGLARQWIARKLVIPEPDLDAAGIRVLSAGTGAEPGEQASEHAQTVMARRAVDLSRHRSTALSVDLIHEADLILCMTRSHLNQVVRASPSAQNKTFLLSPQQDITDPFGGPVSAYEAAAEQISAALEKRLENEI